MSKTHDLSQEIARHGGLASASTLARRWGIARSTVSELTSRADFPEPVTIVNGKRLWSIDAADAYRASLPRARRAS